MATLDPQPLESRLAQLEKKLFVTRAIGILVAVGMIGYFFLHGTTVYSASRISKDHGYNALDHEGRGRAWLGASDDTGRPGLAFWDDQNRLIMSIEQTADGKGQIRLFDGKSRNPIWTAP